MAEQALPSIDIDDAVRRRIETHCFSAIDHEVGGFLVGTVDGGTTRISGAIPSTKAKSEQANLTFTHEAWDEAYTALHEQFPDESLVGWYHSHPGYKVFLSEYDAFIQHNFFAAPGHVALVIDPLAAETGWFVSRGGEIVTVKREPTMLDALRPADRDEDGKPKGIVLSHKQSRTGGLSLPVIAAGAAVVALLAGVLGFVVGKGSGEDAMRTQMLAGRLVTLTAAQQQVAVQDLPTFAANFGVTVQTLFQMNPELYLGQLGSQIRVPFGAANAWPAPATPTETGTAVTETPTSTAAPTATSTPTPKPSATGAPTGLAAPTGESTTGAVA